MLEIITFTGVDAHTDLEELREIAREYPRAEFAVLFGSQTWGDNPIFPPVETVRALRKTQGVNTALHLCGRYARKAAGEEPMGLGLKHLARGFGRIQVNLHGDEQDPRRVEIAVPAIKRFAEQAGTRSVILQHRGPWSETPVDHPMIEYLFDLSEGRGEEGFEHWPDPPGDRRAGYAGGLGPHNIEDGAGVRGEKPGGQDLVRHGTEHPGPELPARPGQGKGSLPDGPRAPRWLRVTGGRRDGVPCNQSWGTEYPQRDDIIQIRTGRHRVSTG